MAYRINSRGLGSLTTDLASAIQRFEGACTSGTCRNNNPGNLRAGAGSIGVDSRGIAIFPDYATGEAALERQVDLNIGRGLSLSQFFGGKPGVYPGYAPAADSNNPAGYTSTVAGWLGIDPNVPLSSVSSPTMADGAFPDASVDYPASDSGAISGTAILALGLASVGLLYAMLD